MHLVTRTYIVDKDVEDNDCISSAFLLKQISEELGVPYYCGDCGDSLFAVEVSNSFRKAKKKDNPDSFRCIACQAEYEIQKGKK